MYKAYCTNCAYCAYCSFMKKKVKGKSFCIFDYLYSKRHVISIFQNVFIFKCINADLTCHQSPHPPSLTVSLYVVGTITEHSPHVKSLLCESWDFNQGTFFCRWMFQVCFLLYSSSLKATWLAIVLELHWRNTLGLNVISWKPCYLRLFI